MHESINEYGTDALEKTIFFSIPKIRDADSDLHASIYIFIRYINIACHVTMDTHFARRARTILV